MGVTSPLYVSPPMAVGKHEWRMFVTPSRYTPGDISNEYQWRRIGETSDAAWRPHREWPAYNGDDTYSGLPRTLRLLWEREQPHIAKARGLPVEPERQGRLI